MPLYRAAGHSGTYTPSLTSMAVGSNGSNTGTYRYSGGILVVEGRLVWGTAGTRTFPSTDSRISLPPGFAHAGVLADNVVGNCSIRIGAVLGGVVWLEADGLRLLAQVINGTRVQTTSMSPTVPGTWADGHSLTWRAVVPGSF